MDEISIKPQGEYELKLINEKDFSDNYILNSQNYGYKVNHEVLSTIFKDFQSVYPLSFMYYNSNKCEEKLADFSYPSFDNVEFKTKLMYYRPGGVYSSGGKISFKK